MSETLTLRGLQASIFDHEEARARTTTKEDLAEEQAPTQAAKPGMEKETLKIRHGNRDTQSHIVTTVAYDHILPGGLRVVGSFELGIPILELRSLAKQWRHFVRNWEDRPESERSQAELYGKMLVYDGNLEINHIPCCGQLRVNFWTKTAEVSYVERPTATTSD
jgi:hypothetical protein